MSTEQREPWFATFTFLDISSTISSSQLQRLAASIARVWRQTLGRLADFPGLY
jgi:hypothetical protein